MCSARLRNSRQIQTIWHGRKSRGGRVPFWNTMRGQLRMSFSNQEHSCHTICLLFIHFWSALRSPRAAGIRCTHPDSHAQRNARGLHEKFPNFTGFIDPGCEISRKPLPAAQSLAVADTVNHIGAVVADEQRAVGRDGDPDGAAVHPETAGIGNETREEWDGIHGGFSILESHENNLIAGTRSAIPGTVFSDESAAAIGFWKLLAGVKRELERRDMSSEKNIGDDGLGNEFRSLRLHARIEVVTDVAVRPAIEASVFDGGQIIGRKIVAKCIALVDRGPNRPGGGFDGEANAVAQAGSKDAAILAVWIANEYSGAALIFFNFHISRRADADVEMLGILAECQGARVMAAARGKIWNMLGLPEALGGYVVIAN